MKKFAACLLLIAVTACASGPATDDWCLTNQPRRYTQAEISALSQQTVDEALSFNTYGAARCGWKP